MSIRIITTSSELAEFCQEVSQSNVVAVDTEFMRERTYYADLCLIQLAAATGEALIDPVAGGDMDLQPLFDLLVLPSILKVMHSAEQDVEILLRLSGRMPAPLFDTQIAAQALGLGESVAYHTLVKELLDATLDKTQQYTDWARRPMKDAQIRYALADVTYLLNLYPLLKQQLIEKQRGHWMDDAMQSLTDATRYMPDPEACYLRVKHQLRRSDQLAALKALAAWREERAIAKNLPRGHVLKDEVIAELAKHLPATAEALKSLRLVKPIKDEAFANTLVSLIQDAISADPSTFPARPKFDGQSANAELVGLLSLLLRQRCREEQVAPRLIALRADLDALAMGKKNIPCMQGWRYDIFGRYAEDLMAGKLRFHWDAGGQQVVMDAH